MRVLLVAHTCRPVGGSEPGAAWNWAFHLSRFHEVVLLCHPQYRPEPDRALQALGNPFRICYVELPKSLDPWDPGRDERGHKLHYVLWQRLALRRARELNAQRRFDVVHQIGLGSVSAPSPFWRLGIPAIWGPLGGGQLPPPAFRRYFGEGWRKEWIRACRVRSLPYWPSLRRTVARTAVVMGTNHETLDVLKRAGAKYPLLFPDSGVDPEALGAPPVPRSARVETVLLWAGRLEPHKALPLALEALAKVRSSVRLRIAGGGELRGEWEQLTRKLSLHDRVQFLGNLPAAELRREYQQADAFLFTSLRDSTGSVVWQALAEALPVITLDHQGVGALLTNEVALKVPVTAPPATVALLAAAIDRFAEMGPERAAMGEAGRRLAASNSWPNRALAVTRMYEEASSGNLAPTKGRNLEPLLGGGSSV